MMTYHVQFLLLVLAGWVNRQQQDVIDYLQEKNRVLRAGVPSINSSCMRLANFLQPECFGRLHVGRFKSRRRLYLGVEV